MSPKLYQLLDGEWIDVTNIQSLDVYTPHATDARPYVIIKHHSPERNKLIYCDTSDVAKELRDKIANYVNGNEKENNTDKSGA